MGRGWGWSDDELPNDAEIKDIVDDRTKNNDKGHGPDEDDQDE
jgi:hypothetical protein